jgi:hypothetical protein
MRLIKTIASYKNGNEWVPQRDIEMHPLEETAIKSHWAIHEVQKKIPPEPTRAEEHEWLIEHGAEYVRAKRKEWKDLSDAIEPELLKACQAHEAAHNGWNEHVTLCLANGVCHDTYPGDARLDLKMPEGK